MRKRAQSDNLLGSGIRGAKRGRPTTRALPPSVTRSIPESAVYADLVRVERGLDWTVARKRAEVQDALGRNSAKQRRTLRIFLSNTCANQSWQVDDANRRRRAAKSSGLTATKAKTGEGDGDGEGADADAEIEDTEGENQADGSVEAAKAGEEEAASGDEADAIPSWTLRVEGRLLEPTFRSRANAAQSLQAAQQRVGANKFSNHIRSAVVELLRDPALYPAGENIVEWHRPTPTVAPHSASAPVGGETAAPGLGSGLEAPIVASSEPALDGFEIRRTGSIPVKARIVLYLNHVPERYALSPELAGLLDIREETRQAVVTALWAYIKDRKLLSEEDRRLVVCDDPLRSIFRTDKIAFHHIPEVVNRHLHPPGPVVIEYWIRTDTDEHKHPTAYDVEIEVEDQGLRKAQEKVLEGFDVRGKEVAELDDRISQAAQTLANRSSTREFLAAFAKNPQAHIKTWMASQARDLDAIMGEGMSTSSNGGFSTEELRRAQTFHGAWVNQAVVSAPFPFTYNQHDMPR